MPRRLKDYRNSYREWKRHPVKYEYPGKKHRCDCCGEEHEGNFCPLCGQKATHGPVTWNSVWTGVMEIWGLHSRSMPYTAWQLLFRPGHLMRDYVTGKRQVSFPPVKMLVLLGVIVYLLGHLLSPKDYSHEIAKITSTGPLFYVSYAWNWLQAHNEWMMLVVFSTLILPTWIVFRHAPLLKRHTLPQGFFIQVFIANQSLVVEFIMLLMSIVLYCVPYRNLNIVTAILLFIYLYIDYKQLFGYNWWGTAWRIVVAVVMISFLLYVIALPLALVDRAITGEEVHWVNVVLRTIGITGLGLVLLVAVHVINRKLWKQTIKTKRQLVILIVVLIAVAIALDARFGFKALSSMMRYFKSLIGLVAIG